MRRFKWLHASGVFLIWVLLLEGSAFAAWTDYVDFSGYIQSDIRYIIDDWRGNKSGEGYEFQRNQNDVVFKLKIFPNEHVTAVIETDLRFFGFNNMDTLYEIHDRGELDRFNLQLDAAYIQVRELFFDWLDLRAGRMVVNWGTADQFNPTDNISPKDFSDPINFSAKVPNQMVELTAYPTDWMTLSLVYVPLFKPAQLPDSSPLGFALTYDNQGCFKGTPAPPIYPEDMKRLEQLFYDAGDVLGGDMCNLIFSKPGMDLILPGNSIENSQVGAKAQFLVNDFEFSLSYYYGRFAYPVPLSAYAHVTLPPDNPGKINVDYSIDLYYPRIQVAGFDFSYSAEWLFDIGIVGEVAVFFPEAMDFGLLAQVDFMPDDYAYKSKNVPSTPFPKATVGLDYTFTSWLYMNVMYVRGFFDEFNDMYGLHNYLVMASELKFFDDELKIRMAAALNLDDTSANLNGTVTWIVYPSVELIGDVLWFIGNTVPEDPYSYASRSKFGQKAVGRNVVSLKGKFSW